MNKNSSYAAPVPCPDCLTEREKISGLQTLCNGFNNNANTDIFVGFWPYPDTVNSIRRLQGSMLTPAGNTFVGNPIYNIDNTRAQQVMNYYYGNSSNELPPIVTNKVVLSPTNTSGNCPSKLGTIIIQPTKGGEATEQLLAQYDEWNEKYEYWLAKFLAFEGEEGEEYNMLLNNVSYYSSLKDNYFNWIIVSAFKGEEEKGEEEKGKGAKAQRHEGNGRISPSNFEGVPEGRGSLYENLRFLFEYRNHYTDNLSITETYLAENNYEEALATLANMYKQFEISEEQLLELKGLETYTRWLQQLENERKNIYELSDKELDYLANYVETNTGRGSVFAHNILCALYGICPEEVGGERYEVGGDEDEISRYARNDGEKSPSNFEGVPEGRGSLYENIIIYPNPTTGELGIMNYELGIKSIEVFDVYGRKLSSHHLIPSSSHQKINLSHINSGIYFVKITTEAGEVVKKLIKQ